jgi:phosphoribosylglycinamide formyltransferase 1
MSGRLPLAILFSGRGSNLLAIARACQAGTLAAEVRCAIADRPGAAGLEPAMALGIPTIMRHYRDYPGREAFEATISADIDASGAQLVVLAGFLRILTPAFTARYAGRLLNIHPSLLPLYPGLHTHERVLAAGDREHGASVHFVTGELDGGPVVLQARVPVLPGDTPEVLAARLLEREHALFPRVIAWYAAGRLRLVAGRAELDGRPLAAPLDLAGAPA